MTRRPDSGGARIWGAALGLLVLQSGSAPARGTNPIIACLSAKRPAVWTLPNVLREVSDLALTDDGRLFANNDEQGVVVEIDVRRGTPVKSFAMGLPIPRGDFEGMTVIGPRVFLITSRGLLFETREGADGAMMPYRVTDTKLGSWCEIEGLTHEADGRTLLILCKTPYREGIRNTITIFRWSASGGGLLTPDRITAPLPTPAAGRPGQAFRASGIARDPASGNFLMVAGPNRAAAVISPRGELLGTVPLKNHAQPEGVVVTGDGRVLVSDEGGRMAGTVSVYACR